MEMAPSLDFGMSSLLCTEDESILYDDFGDGVVGGYGGGDLAGSVVVDDDNRSHRFSNKTQSRFLGEGALLGCDGLPFPTEECVNLMVKREIDFMPASDYLNRLKGGDLDLGCRSKAISWIGKVHAHYNFGSLCGYLAISYMDRFLSAYHIPKGSDWMYQLLAVACLSLAAKMEETQVPLTLDLQVGESKFVFETKTIRRMEVLVLSTLGWRMQSVTPFSFLDYFLEKLNGVPTISRSLINKSIQLILITSRDTEFMAFRPSEIAAAVAISVVGETNQELDTETAMAALSQHVQKERVIQCFDLVQDSREFGFLSTPRGYIGQFFPVSPVGVLEAAACSSSRFKRDDSAVGSCFTSVHHDTADITKRRRLNRACEV